MTLKEHNDKVKQERAEKELINRHYVNLLCNHCKDGKLYYKENISTNGNLMGLPARACTQITVYCDACEEKDEMLNEMYGAPIPRGSAQV